MSNNEIVTPNLTFAYPFTQMHGLTDHPECTLKKKRKKQVWSLQKCRQNMASSKGHQWKLIPYLYQLIICFYLRKQRMLVVEVANSTEWQTEVIINGRTSGFPFEGLPSVNRRAELYLRKHRHLQLSLTADVRMLLLDWCGRILNYQAAPHPSKEDNFIACLFSLCLVFSGRYQFSQVKNTNNI